MVRMGITEITLKLKPYHFFYKISKLSRINRLISIFFFIETSNFLIDRSKAYLPLWILSVSFLSLSYRHVCSLQPCGHLLGEG